MRSGFEADNSNRPVELIEWYESFEVPGNGFANETSLKIKDRYLDSDLGWFDQRSTNEGFLFILFYLSLFISKDTPQFFAIDNIENSPDCLSGLFSPCSLPEQKQTRRRPGYGDSQLPPTSRVAT